VNVLAKERVLHHKFECTLCGTNIELPLCCKNGAYKVVDGLLECEMCGSEEDIPLCCEMKVKYKGVK
jgi:transcription elongation factor Elf1